VELSRFNVDNVNSRGNLNVALAQLAEADMPENETLSETRNATRWKSLRERFADGESPRMVFPDFQNEFYRALKSLYAQLKRNGVDPKAMFEAVGDPARLQQLARQARYCDFARILLDISAEGKSDLKIVIPSFVDSMWEQVRSRLRLDCLENSPSQDFLNRVEKMLDKVTESLLNDPSKAPRRPPNPRPPTLDEQLGESLL
jgi:hypothetical protein